MKWLKEEAVITIPNWLLFLLILNVVINCMVGLKLIVELVG